MHIQPYSIVSAAWPDTGQVVLAQFDDNDIVVYQAYRSEIAEFAVNHQRFGGAFSFTRMSWIKPNFLWMMFRSGWASKPDQERILAVTIPRVLFDSFQQQAVASSFTASGLPTEAEWRHAVEHSDVRLQWDPDHDPYGKPLARRVVQLGLRNQALRQYAVEQVVSIRDITPFVVAQRAHVEAGRLELLQVPVEQVYPQRRT
ncbi:DUF4291 domain-containing protein [Ahniella affigens]|uniref:DUF4291 domain-containing protein n=1 Tax=Ahniella affigens TaxID=2021234 RepID=A0A2P1PLU3_9GAMM|nr:DUF4291 domain-containing protein [Ahniella affigens]AVP95792.1 DUF4291 domain-containing protein [Ahniella affigens]